MSEAVQRGGRGAAAAGAIGLAVCAAGLFADPRAVAEGYLAAALFWTNVAVGALAILLTHQLTGGAWGRFAAPVLLGATAMLPWLAVLFVPLVFALGELYPWAGAAPGGIPAHLVGWFRLPFFAARTAVSFAIWIALAALVARAARRGERASRLASGGLILYVLTITVFAVDWIVAREPGWYTTAAGFVLSGAQFSAALGFACVASALLPGPMAAEHAKGRQQDLGNLLLSAILFLAYVAYMEFLIIWEGDLPAEIGWFVARNDGVWPDVAMLMVLLQLAMPMLLLARPVKRSRYGFLAVSACALAGSLAVAVWLAGPAPGPGALPLRWPFTAAAVLGIGGVCLFAFFRALGEPARGAGAPRRATAGASRPERSA
ncbi:MAG TPA: hypothetical protein VFG91_00075 [Woeseiaceae bacterium]|nr:hypothetical protein [Woeseiaceae bacterium]